ncbi:hypothetical protein ABFS82_02G179000 [Erythranthe guttata]
MASSSLFRSKSCSLGLRNCNSMPPPLTFSPHSPSSIYEDDDDDDEDQGYFADFNSDDSENPATTPFIAPCPNSRNTKINQPQFSVLAVVASALRRSLVTCSVEADNVLSDVDIGSPTDVRHVSHVTFDRFNGFLGLPVEFQPQLPPKPPSASASVFGVSAQSMQCSYDHRGNSVPTILLRMQNRLYSGGGLQAEGIFRINAENSQEENVRKQLNKGIVPHGIDVHCLSGLIKAWFRELPSGVLDCLRPEDVMHCNTEEECTVLVKLLPPTEGALLDWAINLMADVVHHQHHNKMNARNIAMVFAPNMTQMADPLTALIHAVQVMNFLKTLIMKTLRERQESPANECNIDNSQPMNTTSTAQVVLNEECSCKEGGLEQEKNEEKSNWLSTNNNNNNGEKYGGGGGSISSISSSCSPVKRKRRTLGHSFKDEYEKMEAEGILNRLSLRKGMQKLRRHPVFQLRKITVKKSGGGAV